MTFYHADNHRHQVEILRRFTTEVLKDTHNDSYAPYEHTEEIEETLMHFFFSHRGITEIALYFGCPETIIMGKILDLNLYSDYDERLRELCHKQSIRYAEPCEYLYIPHNQREMNLEALRKSTNEYTVSHFKWTDSMSEMLFFLFRMGEDISDIALLFGCPEQIVMQKFIEDRLYFSWHTPWFAYAEQSFRDDYVNGCLENKYL